MVYGKWNMMRRLCVMSDVAKVMDMGKVTPFITKLKTQEQGNH